MSAVEDQAFKEAGIEIFLEGYLLCIEHVEDWLRTFDHAKVGNMPAGLRENAAKVAAGFALGKAQKKDAS